MVKVYPQGSWMVPCWHANSTCWAGFGAQRQAGTLSSELYGVHWFASSWG